MSEPICVFEYILCDDDSEKIMISMPILLGTQSTFEHFTGTYVVSEYKQSGQFNYVFCDKVSNRHDVIKALRENGKKKNKN